MDKSYRFVYWNKQLIENQDFTNFMKYDSGLQSVHRSGFITLKPFEEGYSLTDKNHYTKRAFPEICNYQALDGELRFFLLRAVLTENVHLICKRMIFVCLYALLSCMLCFNFCIHVCFHLISNVQILKIFENIIPIQTFEKWLNVSYRYVSYVKSETSDI